VEHFSRYGVPMDEDDEGEDDQDDSAAGAARDAGADGGKGRRLGATALTGDSDLDEATVDEGGGEGDAELEDGADDDMGEFEVEEFGGADGKAAGGGRGGAALYAAAAPPSARKRGLAAARGEGGAWGGRWGGDDEGGNDGGDGGGPLQHSLPALLSLQPGNLAAMRDSFFRQGGAMAADVASAEAASMAMALPGDIGGLSGRGTAQEGGTGLGQRPRGVLSAAHNWARPRPALLRGAADGGGGGGGMAAEHPASTALVVRPSSPSRVKALASQLVPPAAADTVAGNVCDAFMLLGRSFRAGFGPIGQLAVPVNASAAVGATAPTVRLARLSPLARVRPADAAPAAVDAPLRMPAGSAACAAALSGLRRRTLAALEAHLAMSSAVDPGEQEGEEGDGSGAPCWQLECGRRQVGRLVEEQLAALGYDADAEDRGHAAGTWQLVQVGVGGPRDRGKDK
jgi:hypothetical protein